jgi:hypothetical protein
MKWRRALAGAVGVFILVNVVLSLVALVAKLPDLPHTHATTDRIATGTIIWGGGSIISPPLTFMVVLALLLWGALGRRPWLARACTVLIVVGTLVMAIDEFAGDGGLRSRPALYSQAKWDLALILGWIFVLAAAAVVVSGVGWLATSIASRVSAWRCSADRRRAGRSGTARASARRR